MRSLLFMLLCCASLVQASEVISVKSVKVVGKNSQGEAIGPDDFKMPLVQMANAKVAAKINDQLFIGQLGVMAPAKPGDVAEAAEPVTSQDFSVALDSQRVLTIAFDTEGCGAYCENYASYYSFDTRNGHLVTAEDLLTPSGMRALDGRMKKQRIASYKQQLVQLHTELKAIRKKRDPKSRENLSDLEDRITLNEGCLEAAIAPDATEGMRPFAFHDIELAEKAFRIIRSRCSNHASRALDDVADVTLDIPYPGMRAYLTSYGKALLLNEGDTLPANTPYGQLLRGHVGGATAITMRLQRYSDNSVNGVYFYDKYRKPINVSGRVNGNQLELTEGDDKGVPTAKIQLTIAGGHLKGRWIGNKELTMELAP